MKLLFAVVAALAYSVSFCQSDYLGLYLNGSKIGYSAYSTTSVVQNGKKVARGDSKTVMDAALLGMPVSIVMLSSTWADAAGKPIRMSFVTTSGGRRQVVDASFGTKTVAVEIDNSGQKSRKNIALPPGPVVDDPVALVLGGKLGPGASRSFWILDPTTVTFLKNQLKVVGPRKATVHGKQISATLIEVTDPRAVTDIYMSAKGDLIKVDGPMGIEMVPVSKAVALAPPGKYAPSQDLATATSIKTDKSIDDPSNLSNLKLRITAKNLSSMPSGDFQTATREGDAWTVDIHPPRIGASKTSIAEAGADKPEWLKPSLNIPADSPTFKSLAKKIVGSDTLVEKAATDVQLWVNQNMKPNAGIGVLRDAAEVLQTKEGVCRDYAILTVTLMRAAGIPSRLASGIVNWDGSFYYHAWAEIWNGRQWVGIDSTTDQPQISASHVKLGEGDVEQAFTFSFLDKGRIEVLSSSKN